MQPVRRIPGQPGRFGLALLRLLTEHLRLIEFDLGGGAELGPCSPSWWAAGPVTPKQPRLGLAGIPRSPR